MQLYSISCRLRPSFSKTLFLLYPTELPGQRVVFGLPAPEIIDMFLNDTLPFVDGLDPDIILVLGVLLDFFEFIENDVAFDSPAAKDGILREQTGDLVIDAGKVVPTLGMVPTVRCADMLLGKVAKLRHYSKKICLHDISFVSDVSDVSDLERFPKTRSVGLGSVFLESQ
jgi:hypothetical protein